MTIDPLAFKCVEIFEGKWVHGLSAGDNGHALFQRHAKGEQRVAYNSYPLRPFGFWVITEVSRKSTLSASDYPQVQISQ
jgi:hypothetical protein